MSARKLVIVRHALTRVTPGTAAHLWPLLPEAEEDCVLLAHGLPGPLAPIVTASTEQKAVRTAGIIALRRGLMVAEDAGLAEVGRPWVDDYEAAVAQYLAGEALPGWEPRERVLDRFAAAVARALAQPGEGDVLVVSHGLAMTLYLERTAGIDPIPFWQRLTLPDAWQLSPVGEPRLERVFGAGSPSPKPSPVCGRERA